MAQIKKTLIIGGGFSGMAAAIELRKLGIAVDLVDIDRSWRSYGAGITVSGPTLRAFGTLGVLPRVLALAQGYCADDCDVCGADGRALTRIPTPRIAGPDVPGGGGIMRPVLAGILAETTRAAGTAVRLGCTFTTLEQLDDAVSVTFTDGTAGQYDLVVGADGLYSAVRAALMSQAPRPRYTGQGVCRAVVPRPVTLERPVMFIGAHHKAGFGHRDRGRAGTRPGIACHRRFAHGFAGLSKAPLRALPTRRTELLAPGRNRTHRWLAE